MLGSRLHQVALLSIWSINQVLITLSGFMVNTPINQPVTGQGDLKTECLRWLNDDAELPPTGDIILCEGDIVAVIAKQANITDILQDN